MSFEYLASAPQSVITFPAILLMITSGLGSGLLASWALGLWAEDETKASAFSLIAAICLASVAYCMQFWTTPVPKYETVTATLTDAGFSREERSGKNSKFVAGYLAYEIQDGSGLIYYYRIVGGSVVSKTITLYKVAK